MEGAALPAADITRTSDPYVKATLTGRWSHEMEWPESMRITHKTAYKYLALNPEWYESFIFPVYVSDERRLPMQAASRPGCFEHWLSPSEGKFKSSLDVPTLVLSSRCQ